MIPVRKDKVCCKNCAYLHYCGIGMGICRNKKVKKKRIGWVNSDYCQYFINKMFIHELRKEIIKNYEEIC